MKTMKLVPAFLLLWTLLWQLSACKHDPLVVEDPEGTNNPTNPPINPPLTGCDPDTVYFQNTIFPLIQSNCAFSGCHGNGSARNGVDLSTYTSIINTADVRINDPLGSDLYEVLIETDPSKRMPPPPRNALSASEIEMIRRWIEQGANNNGCDACDTTEFTFSMTIQPIIQTYCEGCHNGNNPSGGILLTNYNEIQARVNSGQLFGTINHETGYSPMPKNQPKLEQCKIDQIKNWIDNGAPND
jgi:hypothetical protein